MSRRTKGQDENFATPFGNQLIGLAFAFAVLFVVSGMVFPVRFRIVWVSFWNAALAVFLWTMDTFWLVIFWGGMAIGVFLAVAAVYFAIEAVFFWITGSNADSLLKHFGI